MRKLIVNTTPLIALREYDVKLDAKKRLTLRDVPFEYYHVSELEDGTIILEPRELTTPFRASANTLDAMDNAIKNMEKGKVSKALDLSEFED